MVARGVGDVESVGALRKDSVVPLISGALYYQTLNVVMPKDRIAEENRVDQISVGCMDSNGAVACRRVLLVYVLLVVVGDSRVEEAGQNGSKEVVG